MAYTERYVTTTGAGLHDGTSEADAFSWSEMLTDIATPRTSYRYNVKAGAYSESAVSTITSGGAATPNEIRGYNSTPGDLDTLRDDCAAADIDTTNFPVITYSSSGQMSLGAYSIIRNLKVIAALNGATVIFASSSIAIHCSIDNTNATGASVISCQIGTSYSQLIDCDISYDSSSNGAIGVDLDRGCTTRCRFTLPANTGIGVQTGLLSAVVGCAFIGGLRPIQTNGNTAVIYGCSFNDFAGTCIRNALGAITVVNCTGYSTEAGSRWFENVTSTKAHAQINNAKSATNADSNEGDYPVIGEVSLSGDPFTSSTDLTLNASGQTDCADAALGGNLDIGAAQSAAAAAPGGSGGVSFKLIGNGGGLVG